MRTFLVVLENNYRRTLPRLGEVAAMIGFTLAALLLAVYMTGLQESIGHVAFVMPQEDGGNWPVSSPRLQITRVAERPPLSDLVKQKYNAFVFPTADGTYEIETLYNEDYRGMLRALLEDPQAEVGETKKTRGVGVNIIGFTTMFTLMFALWSLTAFADDKEQGQLSRIAVSPVSFGGYLAAQAVYCLSMLLPQLLFLGVLHACGRNLGLTLVQHALLMLLIWGLGFALGLFLFTAFKKPDNANMLGSALVVLTTVLSGGFYSFTRDDSWINGVIRLLPQRKVLDIALALESGGLPVVPDLAYSLGFAIALWLLAYALLKSKYVKKV